MGPTSSLDAPQQSIKAKGVPGEQSRNFLTSPEEEIIRIRVDRSGKAKESGKGFVSGRHRGPQKGMKKTQGLCERAQLFIRRQEDKGVNGRWARRKKVPERAPIPVAHHKGLEIRTEELAQLGVGPVDVLLRDLFLSKGHEAAAWVDASGRRVIHNPVAVQAAVGGPHEAPQGRRLPQPMALRHEVRDAGLDDLAQPVQVCAGDAGHQTARRRLLRALSETSVPSAAVCTKPQKYRRSAIVTTALSCASWSTKG